MKSQNGTCSRIFTRSRGAVSVLPIAPATAPARNSTASRGSSVSAASGRRKASCSRLAGCAAERRGKFRPGRTLAGAPGQIGQRAAGSQCEVAGFRCVQAAPTVCSVTVAKRLEAACCQVRPAGRAGCRSASRCRPEHAVGAAPKRARRTLLSPASWAAATAPPSAAIADAASGAGSAARRSRTTAAPGDCLHEPPLPPRACAPAGAAEEKAKALPRTTIVPALPPPPPSARSQRASSNTSLGGCVPRPIGFF